MAVKRFKTLKKIYLTTDLREGAEIVALADRPSWQARTGVQSSR